MHLVLKARVFVLDLNPCLQMYQLTMDQPFRNCRALHRKL